DPAVLRSDGLRAVRPRDDNAPLLQRPPVAVAGVGPCAGIGRAEFARPCVPAHAHFPWRRATRYERSSRRARHSWMVIGVRALPALGRIALAHKVQRLEE